jgi:GNAT superfamily N-acetyltransferase
MSHQEPAYTILPVTAGRWAEMEALFDESGAHRSCWCMFWRLPSNVYGRLDSKEKKAAMRLLVDQPVWSVLCFFVSKPARRTGLMLSLLNAAVEYARRQGAQIVEGYPLDLQAPKLRGQKLTGDGGFMGIASVYRAAGFVEVGRASETQLLMRRVLA